MKRTFLAFSVWFLLLGLQGRPKFYLYCDGLYLSGYPSDCIDRFDTCSNLSPWLYISYLMNGKMYAFVICLNDGRVFRPCSSQEFENGSFGLSCRAKIIKEYENQLPEGIDLSLEEQYFYENKPRDFKVLKNFCIKASWFHLIVDLFDQTVTYKQYKSEEEKEGELIGFFYL